MFPGNNVLFLHDAVRVESDGHTERIEPIRGRVDLWPSRFRHHDRKPIRRFVQAQASYASLEGTKLSETSWRELNTSDRIRRTLLVPLLVPIWLLVFKGLVFDGRAGLHYALQRMVAEAVIALALVDHQLRKR